MPYQVAEYSDGEWVRGIKGEEDAVIAALWEMVFAYGETIAWQKGAELDAGHEAAVAAFHRIKQRGVHQFKHHCPFTAYCRHIVINEFIRYVTRKRLEETALEPEVVGEEASPPTAETATIQERLQPCVDELPTPKQQVIHGRYYKNQTPQMMADMLGYTRNNINKMLHDARKKLKECLEQQGYLTVADVRSL